jgi:hypothetical protein
MQGPMPSEEGQAQEQGGGASQMLADAHSNILKLQELMAEKFPEDASKAATIAQAIQSLAEGLGQSPDAKAPVGQATTTPEAGAADVMPAL